MRIPPSSRRKVLARSGGLCAYCRSPEALMGVTFEVDHITPESAGGKATLPNLCLSCPTCNRHKANRVTATDPRSGRQAPLFHPIQDRWSDHFEWTEGATLLLGRTPAGRATIAALQMNRPQMVQLRAYWAATGHHPARAPNTD